jgi:hypothetical protein
MFSQNIGMVSSLRGQVWDAGFRPVPVFNHNANVDSPGKQPSGGWCIRVGQKGFAGR